MTSAEDVSRGAPATGRSDGDYDDAFFPLLEQLEQRSFWFRARNEVITWALDRYFAGARTFLEVGCGTGFVLSGIHAARPELELTGAELSAAGLEIARRRVPDARLLELDGRNMPFNAEFDAVGTFDVLEHVSDDETLLAQIFRAVKPGGGLIASVPQHRWLWSAADDVARHKRRYDGRELVEKVERAGFAPVRVTSFVSLVLPGMALSRMRGRFRPTRGFDFQSELALPPWLDRSLERALNLERALIARGVSFPVGGSLLVVARRPE